MDNEPDHASKPPEAKEDQGLLACMDFQFTVTRPQTHWTKTWNIWHQERWHEDSNGKKQNKTIQILKFTIS